MTDDTELLRRYAGDRSEEAFAELVRRHVGLVYTVALRKVGGDTSLAEDVTQEVFCDLAGKASEVAGRGLLVGWLFTGARFAAAKAVRSAQRRRIHEQEAHIMHETTAETASVIDWERLRPALDDLIGELGDRDREAVLLRFFADHDFPEIGSRIGLSTEGARARVNRALDQLQVKLKRRGITSTTAALGLALTGHAGIAAPSGLAVSVARTAMAQAAAGVTAGITTFMNIKTAGFWAAGIVATVGVVGWITQWRGNARLEKEVTSLRSEVVVVDELRAQNERLRRSVEQSAEELTLLLNAIERLKAAQAAARATVGSETQTARQTARNVTVMGAVGKPGMIAFAADEGPTLIDAITRAGGLSRVANKNRVMLSRTSPDGGASKVVVDVDEIMKGKSDRILCFSRAM